MSYNPGSPYYGAFTTQRLDTGFATSADSLPIAVANRNGIDDPSFVLTVALLDTGRYKITGTIPISYSVGDTVNVYVTASVNSVQGKAVVDSFTIQQSYDAAATKDWTDSERGQIRQALGVSGSTTATTTGDLQAVKVRTDLLSITGAGEVNLNLSQTLGTTQTTGSIGRALQLARSQAGGKWVINSVSNTLTLYDLDGTTVTKVFNLSPSGGPFSTRTPQAVG